MKVLEKRKGSPNCGLFVFFAYPREVRDAFPAGAFFGIGLRNPRGFRIGVAVENFDAVGNSANSEFQRSTEFTLHGDLFEVKKDL